MLELSVVVMSPIQGKTNIVEEERSCGMEAWKKQT